MEGAVALNSAYQFQLQYSVTYAGYLVTQIGSMSNRDPCQWNVYVSAPATAESRVNSAVNNFHVADNYTIVLRYEMGVATITTQYSIEYPDSMCSMSSRISPVAITTPVNAMAIDVMEIAAQRMGGRYVFSVSYESSSARYVIQELDGNGRTTTCMWMAYSVASGETETLLPGSVANFMIPGNNSQLILRFREGMLPTTPSPFVGMATTRGAAQVRVLEQDMYIRMDRWMDVVCVYVYVCIFVCVYVCMYVCTCVCVCVCVCVAVWCSGCVLAQGLRSQSSSPTQATFPSSFPSASHQSTQL